MIAPFNLEEYFAIRTALSSSNLYAYFRYVASPVLFVTLTAHVTSTRNTHPPSIWTFIVMTSTGLNTSIGYFITHVAISSAKLEDYFAIRMRISPAILEGYFSYAARSALYVMLTVSSNTHAKNPSALNPTIYRYAYQGFKHIARIFHHAGGDIAI